MSAIRGRRGHGPGRYWAASFVCHVLAMAIVVSIEGRLQPPLEQVLSVDLSRLDLPSAMPPLPAASPKTKPRAPARAVLTPAAAPVTVTSQRAPVLQAPPPPVATSQAPPSLPATMPVLLPVQPVRPVSEPSAGQVREAPPVIGSPVPSQASGKRSGEEAVVSARVRYLATVRGLIEQQKEYPVMARRTRQEGTVQIRFVIARTGQLRDVGVVTSSGRRLLDSAALRAVQGVGLFPLLPEAISGNEAEFELSVSFRLGN